MTRMYARILVDSADWAEGNGGEGPEQVDQLELLDSELDGSVVWRRAPRVIARSFTETEAAENQAESGRFFLA